MVSPHQAKNYLALDRNDQTMELLQNDILYGKRYAYNQQDLYPASDLVMGTADISLTTLTPNGESLYVDGANFTPWSRVFVNGQKVSTTFISSCRLQIDMDSIPEGDSSIVVNQMGSSDTIFRSSNEQPYHRVITENVSN